MYGRVGVQYVNDIGYLWYFVIFSVLEFSREIVFMISQKSLLSIAFCDDLTNGRFFGYLKYVDF
jgi:hypothetical protein